jgi:hypothetical protein
MEKIIAFTLTVLLLVFTASCKKKSASSPESPVPTPVATMFAFPLVIDDFEDGDNNNMLGGSWFIYDDKVFGGGNTVSAYNTSGINGANGTSKSIGVQGTGGHITTMIPDSASGYYGYVGLYTTFTAQTSFIGSSGIKFYIYKYGGLTSSSNFVNVWLGSGYEAANNINAHYRASVNVTSYGWQQITIPWTDFTQGYPYNDPYYGTPPQTMNQVLADTRKIGFDIGYDYTSIGIPPASYSQAIAVDEITIY